MPLIEHKRVRSSFCFPKGGYGGIDHLFILPSFESDFFYSVEARSLKTTFSQFSGSWDMIQVLPTGGTHIVSEDRHGARALLPPLLRAKQHMEAFGLSRVYHSQGC